MALHAVAEVAIHIGRFRNVDLYHQGLYQLKCRVFQDGAEQAISVVPHLLVAGEPAKTDDEGKAAPDPLAAKVIESEAAFCTRSFIVKYHEEQVDVNSACQFRIEQDATVDLNTPLTLEVQLMFVDVQPYGGTDAFREQSKEAMDLEFFPVSKQIFLLHEVMSGMHAYCPVTFDEYHFCEAGLTVHTSLVDFRLRLRPGMLSPHLVSAARSAALDAASQGGRPLDVASQGGRSLDAASHSARPLDSVSHGGRALDAAHNGRSLEIQCLARVRSAQSPTGGAVESLEEALVDLARQSGATSGGSSSSGAAAEPDAGHSPGSAASDVSTVGVDEAAPSPASPTPSRVSQAWSAFTGFLAAAGSAVGMSDSADETPRLEQAADRIQAVHIERLIAARKDLIAFLNRVTERARQLGGNAPDFTKDLKPLILPGQGEQHPSASANDVLADLVPISQRLGKRHTATAVARMLAEDFCLVSSQVLDVWRLFLAALPFMVDEVTAILRQEWDKQMVLQCQERIVREVTVSEDLAFPNDKSLRKTHHRTATRRREEWLKKPPTPHLVEDLSCSGPVSERPILFEQRYVRLDGPSMEAPSQRTEPQKSSEVTEGAKPGQAPYTGEHIIVLVHGLQGTSNDMRLLKCNLSLLYPDALFLCSSVNEEDTERDIVDLGHNLADEVRLFVKDCEPDRPLGRLSFVAYSIGGLIVRTALPLLEEYHSKLYTFLSFSSPHLGFRFASASLVTMGLWVYKRLRKSKVYEQLCMTDAADPADSFLSRLAQGRCLEHFQHVVFVASSQDQYAPFESARVEVSSAVQSGDAKTAAELAHRILGRLKVERVIRCDVNFQIPETNFDTVIGRAAHIQFIECQPLMRIFCHAYGFLFE